MNLQKHLKRINDGADAALSGRELNYGRMILPEKNGAVTVIGKYDPLFSGEDCCVLGQDLSSSVVKKRGDYYYGVAPEIDGETIRREVASWNLDTREKVDRFVSQHAQHFMLHADQEEFLPVMARYFVIALTYNYGVKLAFPTEEEILRIYGASDLKSPFLQLPKKDDETKKKKKSKKRKKRSEPEPFVLTVHGCPTEALRALLDEYRYERDKRFEENGLWRAVPKEQGGMTLREIYERDTSLVNGDVFYSGVLVKALRIDEREVSHTNKDIVSLCITFERSTYATVFSMDSSAYAKHPLLQNEAEQSLLRRFFAYDDNLKVRYLSEATEDGAYGRREYVSRVNEYLKSSYNVNQVGITGNLITSDGVLVYGKRSDPAIDGGKFYPSVNGNAEIADPAVSFYTDSADVDYPCLSLEHPQKGFAMELCREAEAELNLSLSNNLWKCYGITVSGTLPKKTVEPEKYVFGKRRLHLNNVYEQEIVQSFDALVSMQKRSVESYETAALHGVIVNAYAGLFDRTAKMIERAMRELMKWRLAITSGFTFLLFLNSMESIRFTLKDWSSIASTLFAVLALAITLLDISKNAKRWRRRKAKIRSYTIVQRGSLEQKIAKCLGRIFRRADYHPVTYLAMGAYVRTKAYAEKKKKKKK